MEPTPTDVPRETLSKTIEALRLPQAKSFATFIRTGDPGGPVPCWGAIAERFDREFTRDADRKVVWSALLDSGDRRPLLLFLSVNRGRPGVMSQVLADAPRLPVSLQRCLVALDEVADQVPARLDSLAPAARQLWEAGAEARRRERELFAERVARLSAFRFFIPGQTNPAEAAPKATASRAERRRADGPQ